MKFSLILFLALMVTGCATAPTLDQQMRAYYGPPPTNAEQTIREFMSASLKDPMSATYRLFGWPKKMWAGGGLLGGTLQYGWGICAGINAKNSFGGYVGEKPYFFLLQDDKVIRSQDASYTRLCD